jgi:pimeloyl-ACP methyl ester carboxylesterase
VLRAYGDGNLFGESFGEGPVRVVFLHGWARRGQDFVACAAALAAHGVASVALDLPGFGSSPVPTVAGGAFHYAELVTPALQQCAEIPLVMVGHSFGGRIATVIAAHHPELVRALILTGVPLVRVSGTARPPRSYRFIRSLHNKGMVSEKRMEAARQRHGSSDYRNASGVMRDVVVASVNESYQDVVSLQSVPVTLVWGELDDVVSVDVASRSLELLKSPHRLVILPGIGHLLPTQAPDELATIVLEALS